MVRPLVFCIVGLFALAACEPVPETPERQAARAYLINGLVSEENVPPAVANDAATCALRYLGDAEIAKLARNPSEAERHRIFDTIEGNASFRNCIVNAALGA